MQQRPSFGYAALLPFLLPIAPSALVSGVFLSGAFAPLEAAVPASDPAPARVTLQTEDKQTLVATYYAPINTKEKATAALLVHDTGASRAVLQPLALRLQKSGFAVLTLDLRGHGESASSELTWKQLDSDGQLRAWTVMGRDVKAGVDYLLTREGVLPSQISMVAHGAGAGLIARHAVRDERVRDLVLIHPTPEVFSNQIVKDLQQLGGLSTLVVVGKGEENAGKRLAEASARTSSNAQWIEVKVSKLDSPEILADKSMYGEVSRWMLDKPVAKPPKDRVRARRRARKNSLLA